jgi:hypothetical protein
MNIRHTILFLLGCSLFGAAVGAVSQGTNAGKFGGSVPPSEVSHPRPKNLKVLPKDISGDDLDKLMHQYEQYLGVPCGFCHEENPQTKEFDYASDENPMKETARIMIRMSIDINTKYLARVGDRRYAEPLTCGNCHQGQVIPPTFEPKSRR